MVYVEAILMTNPAQTSKQGIERILAGWNHLNLERARNEDRWQDDGGPG
jgi:hypothetical protein